MTRVLSRLVGKAVLEVLVGALAEGLWLFLEVNVAHICWDTVSGARGATGGQVGRVRGGGGESVWIVFRKESFKFCFCDRKSCHPPHDGNFVVVRVGACGFPGGAFVLFFKVVDCGEGSPNSVSLFFQNFTE